MAGYHRRGARLFGENLHVFAAFTEDMGRWWPLEHQLLLDPLTARVFEPREQGRVDGVGEDGSACRWARVLVHGPPTQVDVARPLRPARRARHADGGRPPVQPKPPLGM
jgi:hypothetical protein